MPEPWESVGEYSLKSYTKIDVWESNDRFSIEANAVHEYVHAYMIKRSNYGSYLMCMLQIIKNHSDSVSAYKGNQRDEFRRKIERLEKLLYTLHANMKVMQETIASLVEILYVCYVRGYDEGIKYLWRMDAYLEYVKKFEYIVDKSYLVDSRKQYLEYLKTKDVARYQVLSRIVDDNPEIFIGIIMLMDIGILALNIDQFDCTMEQWSYPNAFVNTQSKNIKYNPDKRFSVISEHVLGRGCSKWDSSFLEEFDNQVDLEIVKKQIVSLVDFSYVSEEENKIKNEDSFKLEAVINVQHGIVSMKDFKSFAFLSSLPSITCKNSIDRFYKPDEYIIPYWPREGEKTLCQEYLQRAGTIGIKYTMTDREHCYIWIDQNIESDMACFSKENAKWGKEGRLRFAVSEKNLLDVFPNWMGKCIILYGNYGLERMIGRLNELGKKHYVFLMNNIVLLYGFIAYLTNDNNEKPNATFIKTKDCKNVLVVRSKHTIAFQPMINRHVETIQMEYGLKFGHNIIDKETESVISKAINCYYEDEAYYVSHTKDKYTYIPTKD